MNESVNQEPESFIVQNVTLGPHYVSDIRLNFGPLQAIDLTWEDPKVVKASKDLRNSLRLGLLRKITPDQFDSIEERAAVKGKKELLKQQSNNNLRTVDIDGKTIENSFCFSITTRARNYRLVFTKRKRYCECFRFN